MKKKIKKTKKPQQALVVVKPKRIVVREKPTVIRSPQDIISSVLAQKGANLETLKEILAFQKEYEANEARKAYHKAMAFFKANLPVISKDRKVSYETKEKGTVKYSHASLFNVMNNLTPAMSKYGLSVAWIHKQDEKNIYVTTRITHELGYSEETTLSAPADMSGSKNAIQAIGSTITYLQRYGVLGLLGAATKDQDDDAKGGFRLTPEAKEFITESQLSQLLDILDNEVDGKKINKAQFLKFMKVNKLEELTKADFNKAITTAQNIQKGGKP